MRALVLLSVAVTVVVLAEGRAIDTRGLEVLPDDERVLFSELGDVYPDATIENIGLTINIEQLDGLIDHMINITTNQKNLDEGLNSRWGRYFEQLKEELNLGLIALGEEEYAERARRGVSLFLGALNFFRGIWSNKAINANTEAIEDNTKNLEWEAHHMVIEDSAIHNISKYMKILEKENRRQDMDMAIESNYVKIRRHTKGLIKLTEGALQHRLSPSAIEVFDVMDFWKKTVKAMESKGVRPIFPDVRHLFQMHASVAIKGLQIHIVLHIPTTRSTSKAWKALVWKQRPWVRNGRIYRLHVGSDIILRHPKTSRHATISKEDYDNLMTIGNNKIWTKGLVAYSDGGTCLGALWSGNMERAAEICDVSSEPLANMAWPVNENTFRIITKGEIRATVPCNKDSQVIRIAGPKMVKVSQGCNLEAGGFVLQPAPRAVTAPLTVREEPYKLLNDSETTMSNLEKWGDVNLPKLKINTLVAHNAVYRARADLEIGQWVVAAAALAVGVGLVILLIVAVVVDRRRKAAEEAAENADAVVEK